MDRGLMEAALIGYVKQMEMLAVRIEALKNALRGKSPKGSLLGQRKPLAVVAGKRRKMSAAGRAAIAAAQKKRWQKVHAAQKAS